MKILRKVSEWFTRLSLSKKIGSAIFLISVAVIANVVSHQINKSYDLRDDSKRTHENSLKTLTKPFFELSNYYIQVKNTTYPDLDTLLLKYDGIQRMNIDLKKIKLIDSHIKDDLVFHKGKEVAPFSVSLIDLYVRNDSILIEISRKMIFDGFYSAYFEQEDKHEVGGLSFLIPYKIENQIFTDTVTNKIYLIK